MKPDKSIQQIGAVMNYPKFDAAGSYFSRGVALLLAVAAAGLFAPAVAQADTARGVYGYSESPETYVVVAVDDPDDPDYLLVVNVIIPEGSVIPGNPTADPPVDPVPDQDLEIIQIYDVLDPLDPLTWEPLIMLNPALDDYGVIEMQRIKVYLRDGDDILDARELTGDTAVILEVYGGPGNDLIYGGDGDDELDGDSGNDIIYGGRGSDEIDGGFGNDILNGGEDDDTITGGPDNDLVRGDRGSDDLSGGGGWDVIDYATDVGPRAVTVTLPDTGRDGWGDSDTLDGFSAIRGKGTNDTLTGYPDRSTTIIGGGGDDTITGGSRSDVLIGDSGDDTIRGGDGAADTVIGGSGNDTIFCGRGSDTISGDGTADNVGVFDPLTNSRLFEPDGLEDRPWAWPPIGNEPVVPPSEWSPLFPPAPPGVEDPDNPGEPLQPGTVLLTNLSTGNDSIKGAGGSDTIYGCGGADRINGDDPWTPTGQQGRNTIFGDYDYDLDDDGYFEFGVQLPVIPPGTSSVATGWNDSIYGGPAADFITGGPGNDVLVGGDGNDVISGNHGSDYIIGDDAVLDTNEDEGFVESPARPLYLSGSSNDTVDYSAAGSRIDISLGLVVNATWGGGSDGELNALGLPAPGTDRIAAVENVIGSFYDDFITGSDDNLPTTAAGNSFVVDINGWPVASIGDFLPGADLSMIYNPPLGFDNILIGGFGVDTISGGLGVDAIVGDYTPSYREFMDSRWDTTVMTPAAVAAMIDGGDFLYGDYGTGADGHNDWISGCGGDDEIHGDGGDDVIRGGTGADKLHGDAGIDVLDYSEFGSSISTIFPVRVNLTAAEVNGQPGNSATDGGVVSFGGVIEIAPAVDTIENGRINPRDRFEIVLGSQVFGGAGPVTAPPLPEPDGDVLIGHESLPTRIFGLMGNDVLIGGNYDPTVASDENMPLPMVYAGATFFSGDDYLDGGLGDDVIMPGTGNDVVIGGDGGESNGDIASYANLTTPLIDPLTSQPLGVIVSLSDTQPQDTRIAGKDRIQGCEGLHGSPFNDYLTGNELPNWILGGAGDDRIRGGADLDQVINNQAEVREDYLVGGDGYDVVDYTFGNPAVLSVNLLAGLAANDGEGGSDRLWEFEDVLLPTAPMIVPAGPDRTISSGTSVLLSAEVAGGTPPYTYKWEPADTLDDASILTPTATPTQKTTTYKLTVTDAAGKTESDFVTITLAEGLVVDAGPDRSISLGQSIRLDALVTGGATPYSYLWTPSDGLSATDIQRPMASPNSDTTYTLTVTDSLGHSASDSVVVRVTNPFTISAGSDISIVAGGTAVLGVIIDGGTPPYTIRWTPSTGLSADNVPDPTARPTATTAYTVRVTEATGREASDTVIVTVTRASGDAGDGGPAGPGGSGTTSQTPRTSPKDHDEPPGTSPIGCGGGFGPALALNSLLLLALRRRRSF